MNTSVGYETFPVFSDGYEGVDGLFNSTKGTVSAVVTGGTNVTQPYTTIDFSSYHNYFVELKDVESAEDIVEQLVTQLKPNMDHYIDVQISYDV